MNITKKLMLAAGLVFQLSNLDAMATVNKPDMDAAVAVFKNHTGGKIQAKSLNKAEALNLAKKAGDTPEAQALALHAIKGGANVTNKLLLPKAAKIEANIPVLLHDHDVAEAAKAAGHHAAAAASDSTSHAAAHMNAAAGHHAAAAAASASTSHAAAHMDAAHHAAAAGHHAPHHAASHHDVPMSEQELIDLGIAAGDEFYDALSHLPEELKKTILDGVCTVEIDVAPAHHASAHAHRSLGRLGSTKQNASAKHHHKKHKNKKDNKNHKAAKGKGAKNKKAS